VITSGRFDDLVKIFQWVDCILGGMSQIFAELFFHFVFISGSCKKQVGKRIPHIASNFCDNNLLGLASLSYFRLRLMFSYLTPCRLRFPCLSQLKTSEVSVCSNESILLCLCSHGAFEIFDTFLAHSLCR